MAHATNKTQFPCRTLPQTKTGKASCKKPPSLTYPDWASQQNWKLNLWTATYEQVHNRYTPNHIAVTHFHS